MKTRTLKCMAAVSVGCMVMLYTYNAVSVAIAGCLLEDDFEDSLIGQWGFNGSASRVSVDETGGQLVFNADWPATNVDGPGNTFASHWSWTKRPPLADGETIRVEVDLAYTNEDDVFAWVGMDDAPGGYGFFKDQNELGLIKYGRGLVYFFWDQRVIKNQNVRLVLALTRKDPDLIITTQVLDLENGNQVLFEKIVTDTPSSDPTLPDRSRKGLRMRADHGAPWIHPGGYYVYLAAWQFNSGDDGPAEVAFERFATYGPWGDLAAPIVDEFDDNELRPWRLAKAPNTDRTTVGESRGRLQVFGSWNALMTDPDNLRTTLVHANHLLYSPLEDGQSVRVQADISQPALFNAYAHVGWEGDQGGYGLWKNEDEIALFKYEKVPGAEEGPWNYSFFWWEEEPIKNTNVTLVLTLTHLAPDLILEARVLDLDNDQETLWVKTATDTPESDPVLADRSRKGLRMHADPGGPWLGKDWNWVELGMWKYNMAAQPGVGRVIYDGAEARQFGLALSIEMAPLDQVVLSWPVVSVPLVVQRATSPTGPWELTTEPVTINGLECQMVVSCGRDAEFFRLIDPTRFSDDFTGGMKPGWEPDYFGKVGWADYVSYGITNDQLHVKVLPQPSWWGISNSVPFMTLSRPDVELQDLSMSVDILDWDSTKSQSCAFIAQRRADDTVWGVHGVVLHLDSGLPIASLSTFTSHGLNRHPVIQVDPSLQFRLALTVVDGNIELQLFDLQDLSTPLLIASDYDPSMLGGPVGLYFGEGNSGPEGGFHMVVDNFNVVEAEATSP